jgi:hypothetical protein
MALLTTSSSANKHESRGLCVRYRLDFVDRSYWQVTRTATKSYSYFGMTREAAVECRDLKLAQYTRSYSYLSGDEVPVEGTERMMPGVATKYGCGATFSVRREHGSSWSCNIEVNETDIKTASTMPADPAALFTAENARSYDEDAAGTVGLTITAVEYEPLVGGPDGRFKISYTENIGSTFDFSRVMVEGKASATSGEWVPLGEVEAYEGVVYAANDFFVYMGEEAGFEYLRLRYGNFESAAYATNLEG